MNFAAFLKPRESGATLRRRPSFRESPVAFYQQVDTPRVYEKSKYINDFEGC
jgi:hypothetical protein